MMQDSDCVRFLQWALPQLQMRWSGFRKVRNHVCKELTNRVTELRLTDIDAYRHYLTQQPEEWRHLDTLCRVVITRFYRDKQVFAELAATVLPQLASSACASGRTHLQVWSIGSASGEEPYTLAILWLHWLAPQFPKMRISILGTEIDAYLLQRSQLACYPSGSIRNLPAELRAAAFTESDEGYCLKQRYLQMVEFRQQDIRTTLPDGHFDLILCRNLVFTYFDEAQQRMLLQRLLSRLLPGGWLLLGVHERVPAGSRGLKVISERLGLYQHA